MTAIEKQITKLHEKRKKNIRAKGPKWLTEYCEDMIKGLSKEVDLNSVILENPTIQYILTASGGKND
jgi:hypothetical protein